MYHDTTEIVIVSLELRVFHTMRYIAYKNRDTHYRITLSPYYAFLSHNCTTNQARTIANCLKTQSCSSDTTQLGLQILDIICLTEAPPCVINTKINNSLIKTCVEKQSNSAWQGLIFSILTLHLVKMIYRINSRRAKIKPP